MQLLAVNARSKLVLQNSIGQISLSCSQLLCKSASFSNGNEKSQIQMQKVASIGSFYSYEKAACKMLVK